MIRRLPHTELSNRALELLFAEKVLQEDVAFREEEIPHYTEGVDTVLALMPFDRRLQITWSTVDRRWFVALGAKVLGSSEGSLAERQALPRALCMAAVNAIMERDELKTRWVCETCGIRGVVKHMAAAGVMDVVHRIDDQHRELAPNCVAGNREIKMESPERNDG